jgi:hypothetical protein
MLYLLIASTTPELFLFVKKTTRLAQRLEQF